MGSDLLDLEKVGEGRFPLRLLLGTFHRCGKVIDKVRVDFEDDGLRKGSDEDVADFLVRVPVLDGLGERDSEEEMTLKNIRDLVEERLDLGSAEDGRVALLQRLLVVVD